jgi:hypothetical protein
MISYKIYNYTNNCPQSRKYLPSTDKHNVKTYYLEE